MGFTIRRAGTDDADLASYARIVNEASPDDPTSVEDMRWADATYPGGIRWLAERDGQPVGAASVGRIYMLPPEFPGFWATVDVLHADRRQGIGSALLAAISARARTAGKTELHAPATEARPEGIAFLRHHDFTEYERTKAVELPLAGLAAPPIELPPGLTLHTLAERPDLVGGVHVVAQETFVDIPGGDAPIVAGDLAEFRARDVDRPAIPPGAFFVACEAGTDHVVGYASLLMLPGQIHRRGWHDMTAVIPAWRGRGVAGALKRATIGWAIADGLEALMTGNDVDNAPMRAVNARLGYRPMPDVLTMRGPIPATMMDQA